MTSVPLLVLLLAIVSFAGAELVCPGYGFVRPQEPCESKCSPENDQCERGMKCCYRMEKPCGLHCVKAKDNVAKAGKCPSLDSQPNNMYWGLCDGHFCDVDRDCPGAEKCCHNPCGTPLCIAP